MDRFALTFAFATLLLVGCDDADGPSRPDPVTDAGPTDTCDRAVLEDDLGSPAGPGWALAGPGVDPATGELLPFDQPVVASTTYLRLRSEVSSQQRFGQLMGPIQETLGTAPGLLAIGLATSDACGTARTLTIWESEDAMLGFVTSEAHVAAVQAVSEVSRGGSVVTHWSASDTSAAGPDEALRQLAAYDGFEY